jgi:hypothetical protein
MYEHAKLLRFGRAPRDPWQQDDVVDGASFTKSRIASSTQAVLKIQSRRIVARKTGRYSEFDGSTVGSLNKVGGSNALAPYFPTHFGDPPQAISPGMNKKVSNATAGLSNRSSMPSILSHLVHISTT